MGRLRSAFLAGVLAVGAGMSAAGAQTGETPAAPVGRTAPVRATVEDTAPTRAYEPPTLLIHPTDPETVVGATMELSTGQCRLIRSFDAGRTWAMAEKTPSPNDFPRCFAGGVYGYLNETPIAWGRNGTLYWGINGLDPNRPDRDVSVLVARSTNLGDTWSSTVIADGRQATVDPAFISRPVTALAVDSRSGPDDIVYVGWQTFPPTGPRLVKMAISIDGGRTFSAPQNPYDEETSRRLGGAPGLEGLPPQMQVADDGTLYVLFPGRSADNTIPHKLLLATSKDQGKTFTVSEIARVAEANTTPTFRWVPEGGPSGTLHVVYEDRQARPLGPRDIFYTRSTDGGATFASPRLVNDDDPQKRYTHVNPNMSVAPDGRIDLVWWDFRDGAGLYATDVYYSYSYDNGQSWSQNFRVTERSINRKVGTWSNNFDYRAPPSVASYEATAVVGWDDTALADDTSNTQDLMLALVQLTELPADDTAIPYVIAAVLGLVAGGLALLLIAARIRRREKTGGAPADSPVGASSPP
jgi:hypothetical protein